MVLLSKRGRYEEVETSTTGDGRHWRKIEEQKITGTVYSEGLPGCILNLKEKRTGRGTEIVISVSIVLINGFIYEKGRP